HIRFSLSLFPHLVGLQKLFYQAGRDHFLKQSHVDLVTDLAFQLRLRYRFDHEACPFFQDRHDGNSMPSGLPLCLLSSPVFPLLLMRYSYLNSIAPSSQADESRTIDPKLIQVNRWLEITSLPSI